MTAPVTFLGLCERAAYVRDGNTNLFKWNVIGLKNILVSPVYPLRLNGLYFGFALIGDVLKEPARVSIRTATGREVGFISLEIHSTTLQQPDSLDPSESPWVLILPMGSIPAFLPLGNTTIVIPEPGGYSLILQYDGVDTPIGHLQFAVINPPEFTSEQKVAILADPHAAKAVRVQFGCTRCDAKLAAYAALDRSTMQESAGFVWYQDLPEDWTCPCGNANHNLRHIRRNLFAYLGRRTQEETDRFSFVPAYEAGVVESCGVKFAQVLDERGSEERIQQFIEQNPILLHFFPATQVFWKPPVLNLHNADIGILTPKRELILIELERAHARLLRKNGDEAADLRHAFGQVHSWLQTVDEHRQAVLAGLKIAPGRRSLCARR